MLAVYDGIYAKLIHYQGKAIDHTNKMVEYETAKYREEASKKALQKEEVGSQKWLDEHAEMHKWQVQKMIAERDLENLKKEMDIAFEDWKDEVDRTKNIDVIETPPWFEVAKHAIRDMSSRGIIIFASALGGVNKSTFLRQIENDNINAFRITIAQGWPKYLGQGFKLVSEQLYDMAGNKYDISKPAIACFDFARSDAFPDYFFCLLEQLKNASTITKQVTGSGPKTKNLPNEPFKFVVCMNRRVTQEELNSVSSDRINAYMIDEDNTLHKDMHVEHMKDLASKRQKTEHTRLMEDTMPVQGRCECTEEEFKRLFQSNKTIYEQYEWGFPPFKLNRRGEKSANLVATENGIKWKFLREIRGCDASNIVKRLKDTSGAAKEKAIRDGETWSA